MLTTPAEAIAQAPCFLSLVDTAGRIVWSNRWAYGYGKSMIGNQSDEPIVPDDRFIWWHAFRRALDFGGTTDFSIRVAVKGPPGFVRITGRAGPVRRGNRIVGVVAYGYEPLPRPNTQRLSRFLLSDLAWSVVRHLLRVEVARAQDIAAAVGEEDRRGQASTKLRLALADMVERGILVRGYRLTDDFRGLLAEIGM